jgi:hypothetical protein
MAMSRDGLIRLVEQIMAGEGTEGEHEALVLKFQESVPHPRAIDLIYASSEELTPEEVVDAALDYRPFAL